MRILNIKSGVCRALSVFVIVCVAVTFIPLLPGTPAYNEAHAAPAGTLALKYVDRIGTEHLLETWEYQPATHDYVISDTTLIPELSGAALVKTFATDPAFTADWVSYGGIAYAGYRNGPFLRYGVSKKGFTLDNLKAYVSTKASVNIGSASGIKLLATDNFRLDISSYDDALRYFYPSQLIDGSFNAATRKAVPIVFSTLDFAGDFTLGGVSNVGDLQDIISGSAVSDNYALRNMQGQLPNNNEERNLGSMLCSNIKEITFDPYISYKKVEIESALPPTISCGGVVGTNMIKAAAGERVYFSFQGRAPNGVNVSRLGGGLSASDITVSGGGFTFIMPNADVRLGVVEKSLQIYIRGKDGSIGLPDVVGDYDGVNKTFFNPELDGLVKDFSDSSIFPQWYAYGGIPYTGFDNSTWNYSDGVAAGVVKKGILLSDLRDFLTDRNEYAIGKDSTITVYSTDGTSRNISAVDDNVRYYYPSLLYDGGNMLEAHNVVQVPPVLAIDYAFEENPLRSVSPNTVAGAAAYLKGLPSSDGEMIRNFQGIPDGLTQTNFSAPPWILPNLGTGNATGSESKKNISSIVISPKYFSIAGSGFATDDGQKKAAAGEDVYFRLTEKNPTLVDVTVKQGSATIPCYYDSGSRWYMFTMPAANVSITIQNKVTTPPSVTPPIETLTKTAIITDISKMKLKISDRQWTGKKITSGLKISASLNGKNVLFRDGKEYTLKFSKSYKNIGKAKVTVTGKGLYKGSRTLSFKIVPRQTKISRITIGKRYAKLKWNKVSSKQKITGYQISYRMKGSSKTKYKSVKAKYVSATLKKLTKKKSYQFRVRAYKKIKSGSSKGTYYAPYSAWKGSVRIR